VIGKPTPIPTELPSLFPTVKPSMVPTYQINKPTPLPSLSPTLEPSRKKTFTPTVAPSTSPTKQPTREPTYLPPTRRPTLNPTIEPSYNPTRYPSVNPTLKPSNAPTYQSNQPTPHPTAKPTSPSGQPSSSPSQHPVSNPTSQPSGQPIPLPTSAPSSQPSSVPSSSPTSLMKYVDNIVSSISSLSDTLNYIAPDTTDDYFTKTVTASTKNISCPILCYNKGICSFVDMNTGIVVENCNISSPLASCIAKCDCQEDWFGYDCKINYEQRNQITVMQKNILTSLAAVSDQATTPEMVLIVVDSTTFALELAAKQTLTTENIELSNNVVSSVLSAASSMPNITVDNVVGLTSIIDTIVTTSTSSVSSAPVKESRITKEAVNNLVENFIDGI
jgi:hypothetical protein